VTVRRLAALVAVILFAGSLVIAQAPRAAETFDAAWTLVRDTHFDKSFNGLDWNAVRAELAPRAAAAKTPGELRAVIRDMLARLGQSHFALIPATADSPAAPSSNLGGDVGFDVRLAGRDLLVTHIDAGGSAAQSGVHAGWRLVDIDGASAADVLKALPEGATDRLLNVEAWRLAETRLRGPSGSTASVSFENGRGQTVKLALERRPESGEAVRVGSLPTMYVRVETDRRRTPAGATVGVIGFNVWMAAVDLPFQKAVDEFRNADGVVIDLRGNPGGLAAMVMGISGHFIGERKALGVMKTRDNELRFVANPRLVNPAGERVAVYGGPLAILVDSMTGSASECFAGGMQSLGRARVFGQTSMGQALPALFDRLPNGDVLIHAYGDFVTADGTRLEGRGVVPDEVVPMNREALLAGGDPTLDAALAWVDAERRWHVRNLPPDRDLRELLLRWVGSSVTLDRPTPTAFFQPHHGQSGEF
jgi:carboxyl-terminal processing protease